MLRNTTALTQLSVIVPVYNETGTINDTVANIRQQAGSEPVEIIVADGGPGHATLTAIEAHDVIKVESPAGRGRQMNAGAAMATGDVLLFLHADTRLPDGAVGDICREIKDGFVGGAFSLAIDSERFAFKIVSFFANLRSRTERIPYGDQAQFIRADEFRRLGGFADIPIMEDVELFRRIRKEGLPIAILPGKVLTSPRRWEKEGTLRRTLTNWWLRIRYALGASPLTLAKHYRPPGPKAD